MAHRVRVSPTSLIIISMFCMGVVAADFGASFVGIVAMMVGTTTLALLAGSLEAQP